MLIRIFLNEQKNFCREKNADIAMNV